MNDVHGTALPVFAGPIAVPDLPVRGKLWRLRCGLGSRSCRCLGLLPCHLSTSLDLQRRVCP